MSRLRCGVSMCPHTAGDNRAATLSLRSFDERAQIPFGLSPGGAPGARMAARQRIRPVVRAALRKARGRVQGWDASQP
jgi:hypothetical protein